MHKIVPGIVCLFSIASLHAQDSTKAKTNEHIIKGNEQADNLNGKKIQQQSLGNNKFEKLDTSATKPIAKKKKSKKKH